MKQLINKLISSFDNHSKGLSSRKLSAFAAILLVIASHIGWITNSVKHDNWTQLEMVLTIDYTFIGTMLGMTTYQQIKRKDENPTNNTDTTSN